MSSNPTDSSSSSSQLVKFEDFRMTQKLGEGTFSEVLKVKHKSSGKILAMKRFRKRFNSTFEEIQNLREIQALRRLNPHPHVIDLIEVIFDQKHGVLALNFELMDCNLYELISRKSLVITESKAKGYFYQICKALEYMHSKGIFHRDIKPENILVKDSTIKLADFGSCRGIHSKQPYTEYIATRWYRSPECLLCDGIYTYKMDIWGAGCVLYEIVSKLPLFPGTNELDQLNRIHNVMGTPPPKLLKKMLGQRANAPEYNFPAKEGSGIKNLLPHVSSDCLDLINAMLIYDPDVRISSKDALKHVFFKELVDKERSKGTTDESKGKSSSTTTKSARSSDVAAGEQPTTTTNSSSTTYLKKQQSEKQSETEPSLKTDRSVQEKASNPPNATSTTSQSVKPSQSVPVDLSSHAAGADPRNSKYNKAAGSNTETSDQSVRGSQHRPAPQQQQQSTSAAPKKGKGSYHDLLSATSATNILTSSTNNNSTTASAFYDKIKKQNDDRLAMEVALARARRAKRKNSLGSAGKKQQGSTMSLASSAKGSWSHGMNKAGNAKGSSSKLPLITNAQGGANYKIEKNGKAQAAGIGFPSLNAHGIHPQDKRHSDVKPKEHFTLPSIGGLDLNKPGNGNVSLAGVNVRTSVNGPTALPHIKQTRNY